jgi:Bacteriophage head to tail connecting protein
MDMTPAPKAIGSEQSSIAKLILDRHDELKVDRNQRAQEMEAVARIYRPQRQGFSTSTDKRDGYNLHELFNSKTMIAAQNMGANLYSTLCNQANDWFQATTPDPDRAAAPEAKLYLDTVSTRMLRSFGPGISTFYAAAVPWAADIPVLGTGCMVSDEGMGRRRFIDTCVSPASFVFAVDVDGMADELHVERWLTAVQAARFYGVENLPAKLREKAALPQQDMTRYRFVQAMQPNDSYTPGSFGPKGRPLISTHVCEEGRTVVRQLGMYEQNFAIPRWDVDGENPWGRGLGYLTLASGRKLQAQARDNLQAGALMARPPIATAGTKALREGAKLEPGKFLHGALAMGNGAALAKPILTGNGLPVTAEMERQTVEEVEAGWLSQLLTLTNRTGMGNMEVLERIEERLRIHAPFTGRMQTEGLSFIVERRFKMLLRAGQLPPPPPVLQGQPLEIRYTSVAALAQKASEGVATRRLVQDLTALAAAQGTPEAQQQVWDNANSDEIAMILADSGGAPARAIRAPEDREARRQARAEQMQQQQAMAAMAQAAGAAKDAAGAASMMMPAEGGGM